MDWGYAPGECGPLDVRLTCRALARDKLRASGVRGTSERVERVNESAGEVWCGLDLVHSKGESATRCTVTQPSHGTPVIVHIPGWQRCPR